MKKLIASLLMGVLLLGGATTSFATGIETRGPVLDPVTKSGTKDCKAGTLRLFTLTHSARFTPDRLGSSCQVTNHKVGAKNLSSKLDADVYVQKNTKDSGFTAVGKGTGGYKNKVYTVTHKLKY